MTSKHVTVRLFNLRLHLCFTTGRPFVIKYSYQSQLR